MKFNSKKRENKGTTRAKNKGSYVALTECWKDSKNMKNVESEKKRVNVVF